MSPNRWIVLLVAVLIVALAAVTAIRLTETPAARSLVPFQSYGDMAAFLDRTHGAFDRFALPLADGGTATLGGLESGGYSETNVQVEGVDELDIVKTDGTYLYLASGENVSIVRTHASGDMQLAAKIVLRDVVPSDENLTTPRAIGVFIHDTRLVVVASAYAWEGGGTDPGVIGLPFWYPGAERTFAFVFDVTRADQPSLEFTFGVSGSPLTARLVGPTAYVVSNEFVRKVDERYARPEVCDEGGCTSVSPGRIFYDPDSREAGSFTNVLAFDAVTGEFRATSLLTGYTSTLYMSREHLYLTFVKWEGGDWTIDALPTTWTTIHKVRTAGIALEPVARVDVPGTLLNQFAMDEHKGYLRVATTVRTSSPEGAATSNDLYVFNASLGRVGTLTGLAPGESIFSVRFLGDRAYLVTFRKVDPFFVVDLSRPDDPRVLGDLKIPGYSDYLHPFDERNILGLGKDAVESGEGDFSWYQGLKLSLFDVADVAHPIERARYDIGDRGTESEALRDHKAFLFDGSRSLLVVPVDLYLIDPADYPDGVPPYAYGRFVWQGAYVWSATADAGFELRGRITHAENLTGAEYGAYGWPYAVRRSLYIGDVLYTVSPAAVKANSLVDLAELGFLVYEAPSPIGPIR